MMESFKNRGSLVFFLRSNLIYICISSRRHVKKMKAKRYEPTGTTIANNNKKIKIKLLDSLTNVKLPFPRRGSTELSVTLQMKLKENNVPRIFANKFVDLEKFSNCRWRCKTHYKLQMKFGIKWIFSCQKPQPSFFFNSLCNWL